MTKKKPVIPKTKTDVGNEFGFALAVIDSNKELTTLFNTVTASYKKDVAWSQGRFNLALKETDWYKNRSKQQRDYYVLSKDPAQRAEFESQIKANEDNLSAVAKSMGAIIDPATLTKLANENAKNGWNSAQVTQVISKYISYKKDPRGTVKSLFGAAGGVETGIRDFAKSMGVSVSDDWVLGQAKQSALTGGQDTTFAKDWIRARAKEKYSAYANDLDNGTLEDLSYNFRQSMASTLELDTVNYTDPTIQKAMISGDGKGGKLTVSDFERNLRKDPRWTKTNNAKESTQSVVNDILSSFGLM
jgi:hypothetical protein